MLRIFKSCSFIGFEDYWGETGFSVLTKVFSTHNQFINEIVWKLPLSNRMNKQANYNNTIHFVHLMKTNRFQYKKKLKIRSIDGTRTEFRE